MNPEMYETLHCHTKTSDGELTHLQVLEACAQNNISVVAFTDHDALPNQQTVDQLQANKNHQTKWIIGCELSSGWPKEIGGVGSSFHIVGLFVDPLNKALLERNLKFQESRVERMEQMVKNLKGMGFKISVDDCLKESGGESIGRPHIVAALKKKEQNIEITEKLKNKMGKDAESDPELKEKYEKMIERGEDQYPYVLFLDSAAYIPNIYVDYLYYTDLDETVKVIRDAGGVAILAHWSFSKSKVDEQVIEKLFKEGRLDGAEIVFGLGVTERQDEMKEDMETMKRLTKKWNKLQSGGADIHKGEDFSYFVEAAWYTKKTIGLTERMIQQITPK